MAPPSIASDPAVADKSSGVTDCGGSSIISPPSAATPGKSTETTTPPGDDDDDFVDDYDDFTAEGAAGKAVSNECLVITISCGNTHLHWASHYGAEGEFAPKIFWRTPHLTPDDMVADPVSVLSRNLPDDPHEFLFGTDDGSGGGSDGHVSGNGKEGGSEGAATAENARRRCEARGGRPAYVYVVSSNHYQLSHLQAIWESVPCKFRLLTADRFFSASEGRCETMGVDRLATLLGAMYLHGAPTLVFDGGTAQTYSASDSAGRILGGGIAAGFRSKLRALEDDCEPLPGVSPEELADRVASALEEGGKPLATFARDTREAMMVDAFQEFALKGAHVVQQWLEKVDDAEGGGHGSLAHFGGMPSRLPRVNRKINRDRRVLCTGGDGDVMMNLLQPHFGGILEQGRGGIASGGLRRDYVVEVSKHLLHYGIAAALIERVKLRRNANKHAKSGEGGPSAFVGRRVAKAFDVEDDDGRNVYWGVVKEVVNKGGPGGEGGGAWFKIRYDDGDGEDVTLGDLYEMFNCLEKHGEKKTSEPNKSPPLSYASKARGKPTKTAPAGGSGTKKSPKPPPKSTPGRPHGSSTPKPLSKTPPKPGPSSTASSSAGPKKSPASSSSAPPAKKARKEKVEKKVSPVNVLKMVKELNPRDFVRRRIAKDFDGELFFGTVMEYDDSEPPPFWHVEYDDGDEEDYSKVDLTRSIKLYIQKGKEDKKGGAKKANGGSG